MRIGPSEFGHSSVRRPLGADEVGRTGAGDARQASIPASFDAPQSTGSNREPLPIDMPTYAEAIAANILVTNGSQLAHLLQVLAERAPPSQVGPARKPVAGASTQQ